MREGKIHRAWFVMMSCCTLMASMATITLLSFLTKPVSEALGFSRAAFTTYISVLALMMIVAMPVLGRLLPIIGIRPMVAISGSITGVALMSMQYFTSLVPFYIAAGFTGFFGTGVTLLPTSVMINNWFVEKKGLAMGIAMSFSGVGAVLGSPFIARVIQSYGWQAAYMAIGVMVMVLTVPISIFLRMYPAEIGLKAYGAKNDSETAQTVSSSGVSSSVAYGSIAFWVILAVILLGNIAAIGALQHIPAHLVSKGFSAVQAGALVSFCMLSVISVKVILGWLNDRLGTSSATFISLFLASGGALLIIIVKDDWMVTAMALILFSFGISFNTVIPPLLTEKMFGSRDFSSIYGLMASAACLGFGIGTPLYGMSFDKTGSYNLMFFIGIILLIVSALLAPIAVKTSMKLPRD